MSKIFREIERYYFFKSFKHKNKIKVYDCFLFFNENDLLDVRLNELDSVVDFFIIVESFSTFTKQGKGFLLDLDRFKKFKEKIIYIQNTQIIKSPNPWETETFQRNKISEGFNLPYLPIKSSDEDLIILSDLDEIPKKEKIIEAFYEIYKNEKRFVKLKLDNYFYKFDNKMNGGNGWIAPVLTKKQNITMSMQDLRTKVDKDNYFIVENAGWHYSFIYKEIGDVIKKIQSYSHAEINKWPNNDIVRVEQNIKIGGSNNLNSTDTFSRIYLNKNNCPKYVLKNLKKYDKLLFDYEKHLVRTQIILFYREKIRKIKEYTMGIRNKSSEKINKIRTKLLFLAKNKIKKS